MTAPNVAAPATVSYGATSYVCWVDGAGCPLKARLAGVDASAVARAAELLPCSACDRPGIAALDRLPGRRLGARQRRLLADAPPPGTDPLIIEAGSHAESVARRRAAGELADAGLTAADTVRTDVQARDPRREGRWYEDGQWWQYKPEHQRRRTKVVRAALVRTPLGQAVVETVDLTRPIRWTTRLLASIRGRVVADVDGLAARWTGQLTWQVSLYGIGVAFANDPQRRADSTKAHRELDACLKALARWSA